MSEINKEKELSLTQERLKELLKYDSTTGSIIWVAKPCKHNSVKIGQTAGYVNNNGYRMIKIKGNLYCAHRLAWLYVHGEFPRLSIDHINGNKADNKLSNLREASYEENVHNSAKRSGCTSQYKGVHWDKHMQKWRARIVIDKKPRCLGFYDTEEEAHLVWVVAAKEHHKGFVNLGEFQQNTTIKEKYTNANN